MLDRKLFTIPWCCSGPPVSQWVIGTNVVAKFVAQSLIWQKIYPNSIHRHYRQFRKLGMKPATVMRKTAELTGFVSGIGWNLKWNSWRISLPSDPPKNSDRKKVTKDKKVKWNRWLKYNFHWHSSTFPVKILLEVKQTAEFWENSKRRVVAPVRIIQK